MGATAYAEASEFQEQINIAVRSMFRSTHEDAATQVAVICNKSRPQHNQNEETVHIIFARHHVEILVQFSLMYERDSV